MLGGFLDNIKGRLIITLITVWFGGAILLIALNAGVFITTVSGGTKSYNYIEAIEMRRDLPINGNLYGVYGVVATSYTENTNNYGKKSISNKQVYYAVPFDDDSVILLITKEDSAFDKQIDELYEASYGDGTDAILERGVPLSGVLRSAESEAINYTKEAFREIDITDVEVQPYAIDCTKSIRVYIIEFWLGVILLIGFIGTAIFILKKTTSVRRADRRAAVSAMPSSSTSGYNPNRTYSQESGYGSTGRYDPDVPFTSATRTQQDTYSSSAQTYQPSSSYGTSYQSQQRTQSSDTYSTSFQPQQRTQPSGTYGTSYQSQQRTQPSVTYGTSYQSQQRTQSSDTYSTSFQSQQRTQPSSSYGTSFQSQQRTQPSGTYGTSYQSQQRTQPSGTYGTSYQSQPTVSHNDPFDSGFSDDMFPDYMSDE